MFASPFELQSIHIYPIKSLGGFSVNSAQALHKGLEYDRRWLLVDENGHFLTQRAWPIMATFKVELEKEHLLVTNTQADPQSIRIPLLETLGAKYWVKVWENELWAEEVNPALSQWFANVLNFPCRLVKMTDVSQRQVPERETTNGEPVSFADAYPYLVAGVASLADLNQRLEVSVPMNRFRPNLVFTGGTPFEEEILKAFKIGNATFKMSHPCSRCKMITTDQATGEIIGKEPLKTLATYRTQDNKVLFGMNALLIQEGLITVGDIVKF